MALERAGEMNPTREEQIARIWERRAAALLEIKFASLARAGLPIAAAYVNNPPTPRIRWAK